MQIKLFTKKILPIIRNLLPVILALLLNFPFFIISSDIFNTFLYYLFGAIVSGLGCIIIFKLGKACLEPILIKLFQGDKNEILREDDLILQTTVYSQASLLIIFDRLLKPETHLYAYVILIAVINYVLRFGAKLKDSNKLRRLSVYFILALVIVNLIGILSTFVSVIPFLSPENSYSFLYGLVSGFSVPISIFGRFINDLRYPIT